ncbi:MAG: sn-glycerol-3-phosphate ABC transporter ATP-binding protein UgpC [Burkholderiaceae bacterium]|nr:MAG: sn-glycerol-3-phosphate ABC transporter ATP-binding protein UgpC [Burkholderiaceae bacterium]
MAIVELRHVNKRYPEGQSLVVSDFNLTTADGEFVVLVGPSGCGKTTTMRMIAGLEEHTGGDIFIGGVNVGGVAPKDRDVAMVFQSYALYPHMNVRENMSFSLKLRKYPKDEVQRRVEGAARMLGIDALLERKPAALSGGQRQRVALGRAIVRQPQVFLMDEPLSNLDAKLRVDMRAEIIKLHHNLGITTFYVTHDQTEAMTMGQRIVVMRDGVAQQIDAPGALYEQPANRFVAGFIGTPSMNFLDADVVGGVAGGHDFSLKLDAEGLRAVQDRSRVCVGVRPEHLHLAREERPDCWLRGVVEVVEPLGALTLIHVRVGNATLTAQIAPHRKAQIGDAVTLTCGAERLYLFDPQSGERIKGIRHPDAAS